LTVAVFLQAFWYL